MARGRVDSIDTMSARLRAIRLAYSALQRSGPAMSQSEFARACGLGVQAWHNAEAGHNRIGIDNAMAVVRRTGVSLDYIYFGQRAALPHALAVEIDRVNRR